MAIYDYECEKCGIKENVWAKVNEQVFCECGLEMTRLISSPNIQPDIEPRWEPHIAHPDHAPHGTYITSRQHRDRVCKEWGLGILK